MEFTPEECRVLAGKEFNDLIAGDPEIIRLQKLKFDKALESRILMEVMGMVGSYRIGALPTLPLTAAKWAFLWLLDSPFVSGGKVEPTDLDLALYVLSEPDLREIPLALHELPAAASGYSGATGLPAEEIIEEIRSTISTAFHVLEMFPPQPVSGDGEPAQFDAIWVTQAAGIAARESGMPFDYCLHQMSLSAVCSFFVNWRKRESADADAIRRRPSEEIGMQISERINTIAKEFLKLPHKKG